MQKYSTVSVSHGLCLPFVVAAVAFAASTEANANGSIARAGTRPASFLAYHVSTVEALISILIHILFKIGSTCGGVVTLDVKSNCTGIAVKILPLILIVYAVDL